MASSPLTPAAFVMRYGAFAPFEDQSKAEELAKKVRTAPSISRKDPKTNCLWEKSSIDCWKRVELGDYSAQGFWKSYQIYRGELHRPFHEYLLERVNEHRAVLTALVEEQKKPIQQDSTRPLLQDFKERCHRIRTIDYELKELMKASQLSEGSYNDFLNTIPKLVTIVFAIFNWFHSWAAPPYNPVGLTKDMANFPIDYNDFNTTYRIKIGEVPATTGSVALEIFANFDQYFSGSTVVSIWKNKATDLEPLASATMYEEKSVAGKNKGQSYFITSAEEDQALPVRQLKIGPITDKNSQNQRTGDKPFSRAILQTLVEIFLRQPHDSLMVYSSPSLHLCILTAAGFKASIASSSYENYLLNAKNKGLVFPIEATLYSIRGFGDTFTMHKPAPHARFKPDNTSESWEEIIAKQRFLVGTGQPILPT